MNESTPIIILIDDDPDFRKTAEWLIRSAGYEVQKFATATEFLDDRHRRDVPGCLVLDVRLPGLSGLDLQRELAEVGIRIPIILGAAESDQGFVRWLNPKSEVETRPRARRRLVLEIFISAR